MDKNELARVSSFIHYACSPEEVFGKLTGTQAEQFECARKIFRQLAKVVHPDALQGCTDYDKAAFKKLALFWEQAQAKINRGTYGIASEKSYALHAKTRLYSLEQVLFQGDLAALYLCTFEDTGKKRHGIAKVPLKPGDNDLLSNEVRVLRHLSKCAGYDKMRHFCSQVVDAFSYLEDETGILRQINVLTYTRGFYSLKEIREAYPQGVDPRDMAWIWRRLLVALGFAHMNAVIHGAVLPTHVLIHPAQHGLQLIDWSYAVLDPVVTGERISAISSAYRDWYPAGVFAKEEPTPGLDLAMAARCMIELLGGDPLLVAMPETVPWQIQQHLRQCLSSSYNNLTVDTLLDGFDTLIERLWGPRKFHAFIMPER